MPLTRHQQKDENSWGKGVNSIFMIGNITIWLLTSGY